MSLPVRQFGNINNGLAAEFFLAEVNGKQRESLLFRANVFYHLKFINIMNFFNSLKPKVSAASPRSHDLICGQNHHGIISATGVKTTVIMLALWLISTVFISCATPSNQTTVPPKPGAGELNSGASVADFRPAPDDVVQPAHLPEIGKWMIDPDLTPAHWIGEIYYGKTLREPINIIIVDQIANSPEEAKRRLIEGCSSAGYPSREGHSSGYWGYIGGRLHGQLPEDQNHAFSNEPYVINNNHGRIFGPYSYEGTYLFIGALSREKVAPLSTVKHEYVSFNQARDDFAQNLNRKTEYRINGYVNLSNVITDDPKITTGDHDGMAVSLKAGN